MLGEETKLREALYQEPWFHAYRLVLNLLYLHFGRLGIRPVQRYALCHMAANGVEELLGLDAVAMLSGGRHGD